MSKVCPNNWNTDPWHLYSAVLPQLLLPSPVGPGPRLCNQAIIIINIIITIPIIIIIIIITIIIIIPSPALDLSPLLSRSRAWRHDTSEIKHLKQRRVVTVTWSEVTRTLLLAGRWCGATINPYNKDGPILLGSWFLQDQDKIDKINM